jgi:hypothetical protein
VRGRDFHRRHLALVAEHNALREQDAALGGGDAIRYTHALTFEAFLRQHLRALETVDAAWRRAAAPRGGVVMPTHAHRITGELLVCDTGPHATVRLDGRRMPGGPAPRSRMGPMSMTSTDTAGELLMLTQIAAKAALLATEVRHAWPPTWPRSRAMRGRSAGYDDARGVQRRRCHAERR